MRSKAGAPERERMGPLRQRHLFVGRSQSRGGVDGAHVEQGTAGSFPAAVVPLKHRAGVANDGDCGDVFHITAFNGFEGDVHTDEETELSGRFVSQQDLNGKPVASNPAQSSWCSGKSCRIVELFKQMGSGLIKSFDQSSGTCWSAKNFSDLADQTKHESRRYLAVSAARPTCEEAA